MDQAKTNLAPKMNPENLIDILESIPSNSAKVTTLQSAINFVQNLKWSDVSNIISLISRNTDKVEAIEIIVQSNKIAESAAGYLSNIIQNISSNTDKVLAISILKDNIFIISGDEVAGVLRNISSNSDKVSALKILLPHIFDNKDASESTALISGANALAIIENISSNTDKVNAFRFLLLKLKVTVECVFSIMQNISSSTEKITALDLALKNNFQIANEKNLLKIISTISSNSDKLVAFNLLKSGLTEKITEVEVFLEGLAKQLTNPLDYLTAANSFDFPSDLVEKYKPVAQIISTDDFGNIDFSNYNTSTSNVFYK